MKVGGCSGGFGGEGKQGVCGAARFGGEGQQGVWGAAAPQGLREIRGEGEGFRG